MMPVKEQLENLLEQYRKSQQRYLRQSGESSGEKSRIYYAQAIEEECFIAELEELLDDVNEEVALC
jgi:hypothetical protein